MYPAEYRTMRLLSRLTSTAMNADSSSTRNPISKVCGPICIHVMLVSYVAPVDQTRQKIAALSRKLATTAGNATQKPPLGNRFLSVRMTPNASNGSSGTNQTYSSTISSRHPSKLDNRSTFTVPRFR